MQEDYNDNKELQGSVFPYVKEVVIATNILEDMKIEEPLRIAEFACATGGNSYAYIDFFRKSLNQDYVKVIFNDLEKNPWHAFEIVGDNMQTEFSKGSMYEVKLDKKYAIGFSNFGLQWTTLKNEEKQQIKDAIWIQGSSQNLENIRRV